MKKTYSQFCGLARALDLIGERWTLLAVRELLTGPKRFSQLMSGLDGISTNLLTARLKAMESTGLIEKRGRSYQLTELGWGLEKVVFSLAQWGSESMKDGPRQDEQTNIGWLLLSLTRAYQGGLQGVLGVELGERQFEITVKPERMYVRERPAVGPDAIMKAPDFRSAAQVLRMGMPWQDRVEMSGDLEWFEQLERSFRAAG